MTINFELVVEQSQKLIMTPALQQAIALLQFSTPELQDFIRNEMINNPLLDTQEQEQEQEKETKNNENKEDDFLSQESSFDWNDYFSEETVYFREKTAVRAKQEPAPVDLYGFGDKSLAEQLIFQLQISVLDKDDYVIGEYLIGNLDSYGYLRGEPGEHARFLHISEEKIMGVLQIIQAFEPSGVGARNLEECLLIQMRARPDTPPLAKTLVQKYLTEIAEGKYRLISREIGISLKELQELLDFIRTLNPKPGACLGGSEKVKYIVPDVLVEKVDGEYYIIINDNLPNLCINPFYRNLFMQGGEENVQGFIKKRLDSALWLMKSIEQRRITLYRVTQEIVRIQRAFLEHGIHHLKPLTLKEVADYLGVHESTVSRATANKYVQTPRGLYPLKFFFSVGLCGSGGRVRSALSIKTYLKKLIDDENPTSPYSDQEIELLLKKEGINISRRTITKYRKEMDIPPSFKRRRV
ncbi:MAG TPA: RNA polymerase factor sigma-54 [Firmicutes bacterium]|jgi:RNA polymerase sigma-54 factor|nr:RNA polymerase factor sigma-54 [Bacillota bacterium]